MLFKVKNETKFQFSIQVQSNSTKAILQDATQKGILTKKKEKMANPKLTSNVNLMTLLDLLHKKYGNDFHPNSFEFL